MALAQFSSVSRAFQGVAGEPIWAGIQKSVTPTLKSKLNVLYGSALTLQVPTI